MIGAPMKNYLTLAIAIFTLALPQLSYSANKQNCDSCSFQVDSLDQPFSLIGNWLMTKEDKPEFKDSDIDTSNWKTVKTPGPWKNVYPGESFRIGWQRAKINFNPKLIGQEAVILIDTYMAALDIYLDGERVFHRGYKAGNTERFFSIQAVPIKFKITKSEYTLAMRIDTIMMTGVYQLPFEIRKFQSPDLSLAMIHFWGGEARIIASNVLLFFGFFFMLVFYKTRSNLYLVAGMLSIFYYPFCAFPGEYLLKSFRAETMQILHYTGLAFFALFFCHFSQFFYKPYPRWTKTAYALTLFGVVGFIFMTINFNIKIFGAVRIYAFFLVLSLGTWSNYILYKGIRENKTGAGVILIGGIAFWSTGVHDLLLGLGKINSTGLMFGGTLATILSVIWVTCNHFANTFIENKNLLGEVKKMNENLEDLVEERTVQLRQKTNDINSMLQNLPQGILTIVPGGTIHHEYSRYLEDIFETKDIRDKQLIPFLFDRSDVENNDKSLTMSALESSLGEDEMNFSLNEGQFVTEYTYYTENGIEKILDLSWSKIQGENDIVEKVMLAIRDVTELRALEKEAQSQKRELEIIGQILALHDQRFQDFLSTSFDFVAQNRDVLKKTKAKSQDALAILFRNMHTIKGNSRALDLNYITQKVHDVEQEYDNQRKDPDLSWSSDQMLIQLEEVESLVSEYADIYRHKLGNNMDMHNQDKFFRVEKTKISNMLTYLNHMNPSDTNNFLSISEKIKTTLSSIGTLNLREILDGVLSSLPSLADELKKPEPIVEFNHNNITIKEDAASMLNQIFMHIFRNSMDHGIESKEDRVKAGKSAEGKINIDVALRRNSLLIRYWDDGRGLNLKRIKQKALQNQLIKDVNSSDIEEIANCIFHSGFSSAEKVTEISGRGVGMDAVKRFVEDQQGVVAIKLSKKAADADFLPFEMHIRLPADLAVTNIDTYDAA